jgi:HAD superfamily hydrolase (TIGR01509 family)
LLQNVIFDLGGVLLHWDAEAVTAAAFEHPDARAAVRHGVFAHPDWVALDRGTLAEEEAVRRFAQRAGQPVSSMVRLMDEVRAFLTPKPETLQLLEELHARGIPLFCLSNMHERNSAYLRKSYDFFDRFRGIVMSAHVKMVKPEPGIFQHLLSTYDLDPGQSLFIDDDPVNVAGARAVGLQAVLFTDAAACRRQLDRLLELKTDGTE